MNAKTIRKWLVLGGLLTLAGFAYADFNVQDKGSYYNNASTGLRTTSAGHLTVSEQDPAMDSYLSFPNIIGPISITAASADSSAVLDTHRMRLGMLLIKANPVSGVGTVCRLAVQVRVHLNAQQDTSSTFAVYQYGKTGIGVTVEASQLDTTLAGHLFAGSTTGPWSSEFVVVSSITRMQPLTGGSTNDYRNPSGIAIPLQSIFGRDFYAPYISVRIRNITGPACIVTAHLQGTPL